MQVVVLGNPGAGKTSIVHYIDKREVLKEPQPSEGIKKRSVSYNKNVELCIQDHSSLAADMAKWPESMKNCDIIIFVVDVTKVDE